MAWRMMISGVNRTSYISAKDGVEINLPYNERGTLKFSTLPHLGFAPTKRAEVDVFDDDDTTAIFGGVIWQRRSRGITKGLYYECECVDWTYYLDRTTVEGTFTSGLYSLLDACEFIQLFLAPRGFVLDPAQVLGPSIKLKGFHWELKYASEALREIGVAYGGYVFRVSPDKVWRMEKPTLTATAPIAITDDTSLVNGVELNWSESDEHYAEKVTLICGGTGEREVTETWTVDAAVIAAGYVQTGPSATPTGGPVATINAVAATVGAAGSGSQLVWNWKLHRLTPGTYVPVLGDVVALTFTAQFPFRVTKVSGVPQPIEYIEKKDDITDLATAEAMAQGMLDAMYQDPRTFTINALRNGATGPNYFTPGLQTGQVIPIHSTYRDSLNKLALITNVRITLRSGANIAQSHFHYHATASDGIYRGGSLAGARALFSGNGHASPAISVTFSPGVNPVEIPTGGGSASFLGWPIALGGSLTRPIMSTDWVRVVDGVPFVAPRNFTGRVRIWAAVKGGSDAVTFKRPFPLLWLTSRVTVGDVGSGGSVDVRLQKISGTPATVAQLAAPIGSEAATMALIENVSFVSGQVYELQLLSSADEVWGYVLASLEPVSI